MALEDFPVYKLKDGNVFENLGFTSDTPSPVDPNSKIGFYKLGESVDVEFKDVDPEAVKIVTGTATPNQTWANVDAKKIFADIAATKKVLEEEYEVSLMKMTAEQVAVYQHHLSKYVPEYTVDEYGNVHAVTEPAPKKKKMPKIKKDYVVGDRVEAVREFGKTGIKEGHKGTIVKLYADTQRPLIVQWDDHAVSHSKEWNYPYKDVRPSEFVPGEPTEYSLF